jgi:transposase
MGMARYVVDAVLLERRSAREVARAHGISKTWIYELIARFRAGGYEALQPRSRRPHSCKHETSRELVQAIVALRGELETQGHDAGAETIAYHLSQTHTDIPSLSTIWRILRREGLVVAQRQKRPRCSLTRFEAELPNECWQADVTAWQLASGEVVEILDLIDDHSRLHLGCDAYLRVKAADVVESFHRAAELHGLPASLLSDNGAVFVGGYRRGKVLLEYELERRASSSRTQGPTTRRRSARSSACTRRSSATWQSSLPRIRSQSSRSSLAPSSTTTTTSARTGHSAGARRYRPTARVRRHGLLARRPAPTSAFARTRSTRRARSACATARGSTKSASAEPTRGA